MLFIVESFVRLQRYFGKGLSPYSDDVIIRIVLFTFLTRRVKR